MTITAPYVPPAPQDAGALLDQLPDDKKRPMRVDNEAKACLDQVALDLKQQADAKAVVVGEQTADEKAKMAKEQAVRRPSTSTPRWTCSRRSALSTPRTTW